MLQVANPILTNEEYANLLISIKQEIQQKRQAIAKKINLSLVMLYRNIGERLVVIQEQS